MILIEQTVGEQKSLTYLAISSAEKLVTVLIMVFLNYYVEDNETARMKLK